ncbi:MAG: peptidylprolyl isomerase [Ardenticatenaceae bacterium]|nr:peptidylprolyl isomerase [Anaerolineales bacterium]MCB8939543.1 peptidylprolyl isomerase [Ardenticatenaceae bacterium]MCB8975034.1 peptidylprolyl isomerase [Ardenticatenaceae bacterium]
MKRTLLLLLLPLLLLACNEQEPLPTEVPAIGSDAGQTAESLAPPMISDEPIVLPTETAVPATATPEVPLAALVNNEPLPLAAFEAELVRYERAIAELPNVTPNPNYRLEVLDGLIERLLIRQAAAAQGVVITEAMVDQAMADLLNRAGSPENFAAWLEANQYTEVEIRDEAAYGLILEQMVTAVTADVPVAVEQVHARYIQVDDPNLANTLLAQIQNGDDFATLAQIHSLDRITGENGGDLGFFALGTLLVPEVEAAAFALTEPGSVSEVITAVNSAGNQVYYIVQFIERDPQRPLDAEVRPVLLQEALESWLDSLWQAATVERLIEVDNGS